jgi:hypothetical protein
MMKKGQQIKVLNNPKDDSSKPVGVGTLVSFDNNEVYLDGSEGYENWVVDMNGQKGNRIVHPRHLVIE